MKVLITGAAGFLGSHILDRALELGHEAHVIVRKSSKTNYIDSLSSPVTKHISDLADAEGVAKACEGMDLIIHSAGRVTDHGSYEDFRKDNVVATENLLQGAKKHGVKQFVFVSSPSIFAANEDHVQVDETISYPKLYANYYAETKSISEQAVLAANSPTLFTCSLRPRGIWGERDYNGFFPKLLTALYRGKLKDFAAGKKVHASVCHAKNIADACFQAAAHPNRTAGQAYFIADAENVYVWDLVEEVGARLGLPKVGPRVNQTVLNAAVSLIETIWAIPYLRKNHSPPISRYSLGMLTNHTTYSIAKAQKDFGYAPKYSMSKNLDDLIAWIEKDGGLKKYLGIKD
ncbi:MAG: NAD-dependent epimerase/dehydratase family protein [Proteobacteria bacterium]|nr:MAG: NAD-dependent epimerase/dehydratase family protein [Pseudomonadota bacterium]